MASKQAVTPRSPRPRTIESAKTTAHIEREGSIKLPTIDTRYLQYIVLGIAGLLFMIVVIVLVGVLAGDPLSSPPNALWVGEEWTYETHSDEEVLNFVNFLRLNNIGSVYARVSDLNFDGSWTGRRDERNQFIEVQEPVVAFAEQFNRLYPEADLYGTITIISDMGGEDGYRLDNTRTQQAIVDFSGQIVNSFGYDGVMLNIEPVWDGDENFLELLRQVSRTLGDENLLAVAVPPDWTPTEGNVPTPAVIAPGTVWDQQYKQRVALIQLDQIVVRAYNSYLTSPSDYSAWMAHQVSAFAQAVFDLQTNTEVLIGIPTYENDLPAHDIAIENVVSAIQGVQQGLSSAGDASESVTGVAIYGNWDTDDTEWAQYQSGWLGR